MGVVSLVVRVQVPTFKQQHSETAGTVLSKDASKAVILCVCLLMINLNITHAPPPCELHGMAGGFQQAVFSTTTASSVQRTLPHVGNCTLPVRHRLVLLNIAKELLTLRVHRLQGLISIRSEVTVPKARMSD